MALYNVFHIFISAVLKHQAVIVLERNKHCSIILQLSYPEISSIDLKKGRVLLLKRSVGISKSIHECLHLK